MRRGVFDTLMSVAGLIMALVLLVAGGLLLFAADFVDDNVHEQLAAQKVFFPTEEAIQAQNDPEITKYVTPYAGEQLVDGKQAQVYADHYIAVHLDKVADGKTYSEVSEEFLKMKPGDPNYATVAQQRATLFQGETLRGLLLNAYAFWTMGRIAMWGAIAAFIGAVVLLVLSVLGLRHARRVSPEEELLAAT